MMTTAIFSMSSFRYHGFREGMGVAPHAPALRNFSPAASNCLTAPMKPTPPVGASFSWALSFATLAISSIRVFGLRQDLHSKRSRPRRGHTSPIPWACRSSITPFAIASQTGTVSVHPSWNPPIHRRRQTPNAISSHHWRDVLTDANSIAERIRSIGLLTLP